MRLHETVDFRSKATLYNFLEWWRARGKEFGQNITPETLANDPNFLKKISVDEDGTINCGWKITIVDHKATFLPFKFGQVAGMRLIMNNLESLHNAPKSVQGIFAIEGPSATKNMKLKSLMHCPERVGHMAFELGHPLENLNCSLTIPCESMWIRTPAIESFAGLPQRVVNLSLHLENQQSISNIKQLRNVDNLDIVLPENFQGGLLGVCLIPGIKSIAGGGENMKHFEWSRAFRVIENGLHEKLNVHDIQEMMIEAGFSKFARL